MIILKIKTKDMVTCAVFAAVISVFSVMTVPIGEIPITLGLFGILLTSVVLGARRGAVAVLVFMLIGIVGLPVFSGFRGGFSVLLGPTGGYASSYILAALLVGTASDAAKKLHNPAKTVVIAASTVIGILVCYTFGTLQFIALTGNAPAAALAKCVLPFIPFDIAKAAAAVICGTEVSRRIRFLQ